jgi:putative hemolysin
VTLLLANLFINVGYFSIASVMSLDLLAADRPWAGGAVSLSAVIALVIVGEIVPKTLALAEPARAVALLAPAVALLSTVLAPLGAVAVGINGLLEAILFGRKDTVEAPNTDDFKTALSGRAALGMYHSIELALLHDVVDFGQRRARNLMEPRVDMVFLDINEPTERWVEAMSRQPRREYPVCDGSPDQLLGTMNTARLLSQPDADRRSLLDPPLIAPLSIGAERLVERLRDGNKSLAILLDEYGGVAGQVRLAALSSSVLGEITPRMESMDSPIERRGGGSLRITGDCPLHILEDEVGLKLPARRADTVGGALAEALGRVPQTGDEVRLPGWRLRVAVVRGGRVERVLVRRSDDDVVAEDGT